MSSRGVTTTENETFLGIRLPSIFLVDTEEGNRGHFIFIDFSLYIIKEKEKKKK